MLLSFFFISQYQIQLMIFMLPAILLGLWAQARVRSSYAAAQRQPSKMSGAAIARRVLDSSGLTNIPIEEVGGRLSDHYDPRQKVVRLSSEVFHGRNLAATGIAAHEVGHAIQDARNYAPLVIRNLAAPAAGFGSSAGMILAMLGLFLNFQPLLFVGIVVFSLVVIFQVVNLPVEFNASSRAKNELLGLGLIDPQSMPVINRVLSAAALTYVAATLQSVLTLLYFVLRFSGRRS